MCDCVNVEFGSYDNQVEVAAPSFMLGFGEGCVEVRPTLCIDTCILPEIKDLWSNGIITLGCCCGHNKQDGLVGVAERCIEAMRGLGYKNALHCSDHIFTSKTCNFDWPGEVTV